MTTIQDLLSIWDDNSEAIEQIQECLWEAEDIINEKYGSDVEVEVEEVDEGEYEIVIEGCTSEIQEELLEEATNYASENYPELFF